MKNEKNKELFLNFLQSYTGDNYLVESAANLYNIFKASGIIINSDIVEIIEQAAEMDEPDIYDIEEMVREDYLIYKYCDEVDRLVVEEVENDWNVGPDSYIIQKLYEHRFEINGLDKIGLDEDFDNAFEGIAGEESNNVALVVSEVLEQVEEIGEIRKAFEYVVNHRQDFFAALGSSEFNDFYNNCVMIGETESSLEEFNNDIYELIRNSAFR